MVSSSLFFFFSSSCKKKNSTQNQGALSPPPLPLEDPKKTRRGGEALPFVAAFISLYLSLFLSISGVRHLVAEKLKLAPLSLLPLQAPEREHAPGPEPPPLPLRERLAVDEHHGLGADVRHEQRRARPDLLRALGASDLLELHLPVVPLRRRGIFLLLDGELHAPDAEEARERDVVGGPAGVGDGDKVLGAERGCV